MSRNIISAQKNVAAPISTTQSPETPSASKQGDLPKITMPQSGPRILFWRAGVVAEDSPAPTLAERIDAIGQALARYRRIVRTSEAVIAGGDLSAEAMRAEHDALSALLARVSVQETQIKTLCETLHNQRGRFLSSWRVTEREILTTNCGQLLRDMQAVLQRIKRVQVDISGRLLEQE